MPGLQEKAVALGVIAGSGAYPREIIHHAQARGWSVCVLAIEKQCDPETVAQLPHLWLPLGSIGRALRFLRQQRVTHVVMAGGVRRPALTALQLDVTGALWLARMAAQARGGDDALLRGIMTQLEAQGLQILSSRDIVGQGFFMEIGAITRAVPDACAHADMVRGQQVLHILAPADIGQAVVVQQGLVLGIEAIEGTAQLIARCGTLQRAGAGGVLVKISKRGQDLRADMPTIGPETIDQAVAAGLRGLALEADNVQILDKPQVVAKANAAGVFIYGVKANDD